MIARILLLPLLLLATAAHGQTISIVYRGVRNLDNSAVDQNGVERLIGGLSGITRRGGDEYLAVQDNYGRIVRFAITLHENGAIDSIKCPGAIALNDARDFEGIAMAPRSRDRVFLSEEQTPAVHEYDLTTGNLAQTFRTPKAFAGRNLRSNFGFESLTANDRLIWTANEEALKIDGALSDDKSGCAVRLLCYDVAKDRIEPGAQYVYITDPIHSAGGDAGRGLRRSGVSDLLLLPDGRLLALERSYAMTGPIPDFRSAIYEIDFDGATDVSGAKFENGLIGQRFNPVTKKLLWSHRGPDIGNLEGIALGPQLGPNRWALVGAIDNNNHKLLTNRAVAFELRIEDKR